METAALVFENEPTVPIECTRFARERWWTWYQCIGSEYQETVDFAAGLGRRILGLDTLNSLDQFWNPVEEIAAISRLQSECANFEERKRRYEPSARELEANHPHELTNYLARHEADVIAVACHWGVIHELTGASPNNCDIVVADLIEENSFSFIEQHEPPGDVERSI